METNEIIPHAPPNRDETKQYARLLFVNCNISVEQIAGATTTSISTIDTWRQAGNWDEERILQAVSPASIIKRLNGELDFILNYNVDERGEKKKLTLADVNLISKLTKSIKEMQQSSSPQVAMEVLYEFMNWLAQTQPDLAKQLATLVEAYVKDKMKP